MTEEQSKSSQHAEQQSIQLLELPPELIYEIIKRLDPPSLNQLRNTNKYLRERVDDFKVVFKDEYLEMIKRQRAYVDDEDEEDDEYGWVGSDEEYDDSGDDYLEDMLDRLSCGSNYDEELDDLLHGR